MKASQNGTFLAGCLSLVILGLSAACQNKGATATVNASDRGEKNFSFSELMKSDNQTFRQQPAPSPSVDGSRAGEAAGQAGSLPWSATEFSGQEVRTSTEPPEGPPLSSKYGTEPNQPGNVPGVGVTSPHGTSNPYGTGGKPLFPKPGPTDYEDRSP